VRLPRFIVAALLLAGCSTPRVLANGGTASYSTVAVENAVVQSQPLAAGMIEIGAVTAEDLAPAKAKFDELVKAGDKTVLFRINSFGGSVFEGIDFLQYIENTKKTQGIHVQCVVDTKAMSMGFVFLQSFCDERLMTKRSVLLAHNSSTRLQGTAEEIEKALKFSRALDAALAEICAKRLHMSVAAYKKKIAHNDWTFGWEEALKVGAIDGTVDEDSLPALYPMEPVAENPLRKLFGR
jgi:ATP-dependent protease ClpP protease subunit